jgi:hypothetical protein
MGDSWSREFARQIEGFGGSFEGQPGIAVSVKVRVVGGCFHREHSPHAYRLIDAAIREPGLGSAIQWREHESGPELLVWIPLVTAGLAFSAAAINLVVSILKARSEGIKAGDRPREALELIVRTTRPDEGIVEEKILRFDPQDRVHVAVVGKALEEAARKMLPPVATRGAPALKKKGARRRSK